MSEHSPEQNRPDPNATEQWRIVLEQCESGLRAFLRRRLGQDADVDDCLQAVRIRMIEQVRRTDSSVAPAARKAWLFRVAANEAARLWRERAVDLRMLERQVNEMDGSEHLAAPAIDKVMWTETISKVRGAIDRLPQHYRDVVKLRMDRDLTFQQIAEELGIPLGTALTRMRRAIDRIRSEMAEDENTKND
jgi:RNA polymerase sigma-70 factor (ECF subfamily)